MALVIREYAVLLHTFRAFRGTEMKKSHEPSKAGNLQSGGYPATLLGASAGLFPPARILPSYQ